MSEPHTVSGPSTHEEIMASDNLVIKTYYDIWAHFNQEILYHVSGGRTVSSPWGLFRTYEEAVGFALRIIDVKYDGVGRYSRIKSTGPHPYGIAVWDQCGTNKDEHSDSRYSYWVPSQIEITIRSLLSFKKT